MKMDTGGKTADSIIPGRSLGTVALLLLLHSILDRQGGPGSVVLGGPMVGGRATFAIWRTAAPSLVVAGALCRTVALTVTIPLTVTITFAVAVIRPFSVRTTTGATGAVTVTAGWRRATVKAPDRGRRVLGPLEKMS